MHILSYNDCRKFSVSRGHAAVLDRVVDNAESAAKRSVGVVDVEVPLVVGIAMVSRSFSLQK